MLTDGMKRLIEEQRLAFVATVCPDGTANLSPKGTLVPWGDTQLVFAHLYSPQTVENLLHNPSIEVNVVDVFRRKGYRFKGTAEVLNEGDEYEQIMTMYRGESGHDPLRDPDRRVKAVVLMTIDRTEELISPAYDGGASEAEITVEWTEYWDSLYPLEEKR